MYYLKHVVEQLNTVTWAGKKETFYLVILSVIAIFGLLSLYFGLSKVFESWLN